MQRHIVIEPIPFGWPQRILAVLFAALLLLLGLAFGALALGLGLVTGLGLALRLWWLRRRIRREVVCSGTGTVIEGEYRRITS